MLDNVLVFPSKSVALRSNGRIFCGPLGLEFPELIRIEGRDPSGGLTRGRGGKPVRGYAVGLGFDHGLLDATCEATTYLDDREDFGVITLRHHHSEESVNGYINAIWDFCETPLGFEQIAFDTQEGLFTLLHRRPPPNFPDRLVIYQADVPTNGRWERWQHAVDRDGRPFDLASHLPWVL